MKTLKGEIKIPEGGSSLFLIELSPSRFQIIGANLIAGEIKREGIIKDLFVTFETGGIKENSVAQYELIYKGEDVRVVGEKVTSLFGVVEKERVKHQPSEIISSGIISKFLSRKKYIDTEITKTENKDYIRAHRFFYEFDFQMHPIVCEQNPALTQINGSKKSKYIQDCVGLLKERIFRRAEAYLQDKPIPKFLKREENIDSRIVSHLSSMQMEIIREHYGDKNNDLVIHQIEYAFEKFANRDLRINLPEFQGAGEPNGAQFFFFAEFAFLALEHEIEEWRPLLNLLVRILEIFLYTYPPEESPIFNGYSSDRRPVKRYSYKNILNLRKRYKNLDLENELGRIAAKAFSENVKMRQIFRHKIY